MFWYILQVYSLQYNFYVVLSLFAEHINGPETLSVERMESCLRVGMKSILVEIIVYFLY